MDSLYIRYIPIAHIDGLDLHWFLVILSQMTYTSAVLKIKPVRPPDNGQKIVWVGRVPCRTGNFSSYLHITAYK